MSSVSKILLIPIASLSILCAQPKGGPRGFAQPGPAVEVTVKAIPGVVADGVKVASIWQGEATADGMSALDGGIISAQEQTNKINRIDKSGKFSTLYDTPHGPGAVSIGPKGKVLVVERSCTDPGGHLGVKPEDCKEATDVAELTPTRKVLADNIDGKPLGRVNDLIADKKGGAYFTSGGVFYMRPDHKVITIGANIRPNGITLSRDEKTLYVTNGATIAALDIQPDGSATNQSGRHNGRDGLPKAGDPWHFANAAEIAWSMYLMGRMDGELAETGALKFTLDGKRAVIVGPGFIEFHFHGRVDRCEAGDIKKIGLSQGTFSIQHRDAKWYSSKGKFSFPYGNMPNARVFLLVLDRFLPASTWAK